MASDFLLKIGDKTAKHIFETLRKNTQRILYPMKIFPKIKGEIKLKKNSLCY